MSVPCVGNGHSECEHLHVDDSEHVKERRKKYCEFVF